MSVCKLCLLYELVEGTSYPSTKSMIQKYQQLYETFSINKTPTEETQTQKVSIVLYQPKEVSMYTFQKRDEKGIERTIEFEKKKHNCHVQYSNFWSWKV